ncbi:OmpA family protein [Pseudomonas sp. 18175]|uniref:OmpA family protein n=1 Tax=Pseudomonas sp. 18175 TaxID=3390056 RepID=UPI003D2550F6
MNTTVLPHVALMGVGALLLSACRSVPVPQPGMPEEAPRLAQFGHGRDAPFVLCLSTTCPAVTAKTLHVVQAARPIPSWRGQVTFALGSAVLDTAARDTLDALTEVLSGARRLTLIGYTDAIGTPARNAKLAVQRAQAVHAYLQDELEAGTAVSVDGQGACCYLAPNETDTGRRQNRRVELQIDYGSPS